MGLTLLTYKGTIASNLGSRCSLELFKTGGIAGQFTGLGTKKSAVKIIFEFLKVILKSHLSAPFLLLLLLSVSPYVSLSLPVPSNEVKEQERASEMD